LQATLPLDCTAAIALWVAQVPPTRTWS
jgi:hypothetical protein